MSMTFLYAVSPVSRWWCLAVLAFPQLVSRVGFPAFPLSVFWAHGEPLGAESQYACLSSPLGRQPSMELDHVTRENF